MGHFMQPPPCTPRCLGGVYFFFKFIYETWNWKFAFKTKKVQLLSSPELILFLRKTIVTWEVTFFCSKCKWRNLTFQGRMCQNPTTLHFSAKMCPKKRKWKFSEMVRGRSGQVRNVPIDFLRSLRTEIWWHLVGMSNADGCEVGQMCCILAQILRCIETEQKWVRKSENESFQNWSEEVQDKSATCPRSFQSLWCVQMNSVGLGGFGGNKVFIFQKKIFRFSNLKNLKFDH